METISSYVSVVSYADYIVLRQNTTSGTISQKKSSSYVAYVHTAATWDCRMRAGKKDPRYSR